MGKGGCFAGNKHNSYNIIITNQMKSLVLSFCHLYLICVHVQTGEDKRIKEFYQSRGLERIIQPAGDGKSLISYCLSLELNLFKLDVQEMCEQQLKQSVTSAFLQ